MKNDFKFEADWKLFRERIPGWQERYMGHLLCEYAEIIADDAPASERFRRLKERISEDKEKNGVSLYMRRKTLLFDVIILISEGAIDLTDLEGFSPEFIRLIRLHFNGRTGSDAEQP